MNIVSLRLVVAAILAMIGVIGLTIGLSYDFGSARRMGTGYFPVLLSGILLLLALTEGVTAILKPEAENSDPIDWRPLFSILAAVAAFAMTIPFLGLIPAFLVVVGLSSLSEAGYGWKPALALSIVSCIVAWLLFSQLLGMTLPLFSWRF